MSFTREGTSNVTAPRCICPGATWLVTRRCSDGRFLTPPREDITAVLKFSLGLASEATGIRLHCAQFLSNHFHLVVTDPEARLSEFMERLDSVSGREINRIWKRKGCLWDGSEHFGGVRLYGADTVLEKMEYTLANVAAAGLVGSHRDWPGLTSTPEMVGRTETVARPKTFSKRSSLPASVELRFTEPPGFDDLELGEFQDLLGNRVAAREEEIRASAEARGLRFRGAKIVSGDSPSKAAPRPPERAEVNPKIACSDRDWRKELLEALFDFYRKYRDALREFSEGIRHAVFPFGTYAMRVRYGVNCAPAPT